MGAMPPCLQPRIAWGSLRQADAARRSLWPLAQQAAHAFQVLRRVDAGAGRLAADVHRDALAMPQHAQLLQRLAALQRRRRQRGKAAQKGRAIGIKADVAQRRRVIRRQAGCALGRVAPMRNRRAAEVQRATARVEHHLHDVGVAEVGMKLALDGRNPDDGMSDIAYNKGYFFLRLIEETVGREKFDKFVKDYFTSHSFQVMDTETFIAYLKKNLLDAESEKKINIDAWVYGEGLPDNIPVVQSEKMKEVESLRQKWESGKIGTDKIPFASWTYQEQYQFIFNLSTKVSTGQMAALDKVFHISSTGNNEVLFAWLKQSISKKYTAAYPALEQFLIHVGRRKFVAPLFEELVSTGQKPLALKIYKKSRPNYHAVTIGTVDEILGLTVSEK